MELAKALALTASAGILAGLTACASEPKAGPSTPTTNSAPPTEKSCCKAKNECRGRSGCKTSTNPSCAGNNGCRGQGTSCSKT